MVSSTSSIVGRAVAGRACASTRLARRRTTSAVCPLVIPPTRCTSRYAAAPRRHSSMAASPRLTSIDWVRGWGPLGDWRHPPLPRRVSSLPPLLRHLLRGGRGARGQPPRGRAGGGFLHAFCRLGVGMGRGACMVLHGAVWLGLGLGFLLRLRHRLRHRLRLRLRLRPRPRLRLTPPPWHPPTLPHRSLVPRATRRVPQGGARRAGGRLCSLQPHSAADSAPRGARARVRASVRERGPASDPHQSRIRARPLPATPSGDHP